jgi:hypothetical protein
MEEGHIRTRTISEVDIPILMPESKGRKRPPKSRWGLVVLLLLLAGFAAWRFFRRGQ